MEGDKVKGMGWFLLAWFTLFLVMCTILATAGCMTIAEPLKPNSGAICMTAEMYQKTIDDAFNAGHEEARLEIRPRAAVELNLITLEQLKAFLITDQCDRCGSSVPTEDASLACLDRADCLMAAARIAGWDAYGVVMNFKDGGAHAIVTFPLKDGTLVFVEPWHDVVVRTPVVGDTYYNTHNVIEKIGILK
jgi:hypothetical protein